MKILKYFVFFICVPIFSWASTHIVNQAFFLNSVPEKSWNSKDRMIVLGAEKVDFRQIVKARKKFPKTAPIYWLMSDDQWHFNNITLDKDKKVIDFANQMEEIYIQVLPDNLCPKPSIFHEKNHDILVIDSSWLLFPHQVELFTGQCGSVDLGKFYNEIEQAILNAKLKPLVIISHHGIHPKLIYNEDKDSLVLWANKIHESLGPMDGISNPAYQKYQEKMNKMIANRPNLMVVSANTSSFFRDSNESLHHIALSQSEPNDLFLKDNQSGAEVISKDFPEPIQLKFNQRTENENAMCEKHTGAMDDFRLRGSLYEFFFGSNYRKLWNQQVSIDCFSLEKEKLTIDRIGGSLRSPDFQLKDKQGRFYTLRPLKKEIRLPQIFEDTIVETVLRDQQSALQPLGFILAASLAKQTGIPHEISKLVYVDVNQKSFSVWNDKVFHSGFYQFVQQPLNLLKDEDWKKKGVLEIIPTQEMVRRLENESGYRIDQEAYLRERLFDILIGDWDRQKDQWQWIVVQSGEEKILYPFPVDRDAAFYLGDGSVSWWRRRKWVNYKLQNYGRKLKHPDPMMIQSFSMDHRFTFSLTQSDWDRVVADLQQSLPPDSMEKAIATLPVPLPNKDHQWLVRSFQKRLKELPNIASQMRGKLRESVDIVGTPNKDTFYIQSGPGHFVHVSLMKNNERILSDTFDSKKTKEIRIYGLDGDDDFKLNWGNNSSTRIRLIPGHGKDNIIARDQSMKPRVSLYDNDDLNVDSLYGFVKRDYQSTYNEYYSQINQRKLNVLAPVLFLASSNADSGFVVGGGLKYYKEGFQHAPWSSTNELKANAVLNRAAANILYQGTWFDVSRKSDFQTDIDAGLPRFYGSFFGLGNSPPDLDPTKSKKYYWLRARHLESTAKLNIPIFQYVTLIPKLQFRFRDYIVDTNSFLNVPVENNLDTQLGAGTNGNIKNTNYYLGTGLSLKYVSDDSVSGPMKKRIIRANAQWMFQQGLAKEDGRFQTLDVDAGLTGYFRRSKTQWKAGMGYGQNFGNWEFFDAQFLGQGQNLRGFFMNRFGGSARIYSSLEINQSLLFRKRSVITDYGLGMFFDNGRVFMDNDPGSSRLHKALGAQAWITALNSLAFKFGYSHAIFEDQKGFWSFVLTTEL